MKSAIFGIGCMLSVAMFSSCFTGIENTGHISEKDVEKARAGERTAEDAYLDSIVPAPYASWQEGKQFYVADNNIRLIFSPQTDSLQGSTLRYVGSESFRQIDNTEEAVLVFSDGQREYRYDTGKTFRELEETPAQYLVPFMTDMDFVEQVDSMLRGKELYIKTSDWRRPDGTAERGVRYVAVRVTDVTPGDAVYPFYVAFECDGRNSGVFMSSATSSVRNMTFGKLFSFSDIRKHYRSISDDNWALIVNGKVKEGMTKEECSLSLGAPRTIDRMPTRAGLYERWVYVNGVMLVFENGLLTQYRQ